MVHILNDIVYKNQEETVEKCETYSEQLGMFDALGLSPNESDLYIWDADFGENSIRIFDNKQRIALAFPTSELELLISPGSVLKLRTITEAFASGAGQIIDETLKFNINGKWNVYHVKGVLGYIRGEKFAAGVAIDVEKANLRYQRLEYLETHDSLTGLLNLQSFEAQFEKLVRYGMYPLSLVMFKIENLSDACGTMGYQAGNTLICNVADVLKDSFFDADIIARTGNGEYCCAFTGKNQLEIETRIGEATLKLHSTYLNLIKTEIICGYAIADGEMDFSHMYHLAYQNLVKRSNTRRLLTSTTAVDHINAIISKKTGWGKRVVRLQSLSAQIGKALFCKEDMLSEIKLLAKIADIGLIGLDDRLLANRLNLNEDEKLVYDSHYELGRDIILGIYPLAQLESLYVDLYKRYEEWQDAIAMPSCIVTVVRAFDDMMLADGSLSYRELCCLMERQKGKQFCPAIVEVMLEVARKYHTWPITNHS